MSMIDLDAMEAVMEATETLYGVSSRDMVKILQFLDTKGWHITRKPEPAPEVHEEAEPELSEPIHWHPWNDRDLLYCIDEDDGDPSEIPNERIFISFCRHIERGHTKWTMVRARNQADAISVWNARGDNPTDTIKVSDGRSFSYTYVGIPF